MATRRVTSSAMSVQRRRKGAWRVEFRGAVAIVEAARVSHEVPLRCVPTATPPLSWRSYAWIPLFGASLTYLSLNGMKWSELRDSDGSPSTTAKARCFLFTSLLVLLACIIGAAVLMVQVRASARCATPADRATYVAANTIPRGAAHPPPPPRPPARPVSVCARTRVLSMGRHQHPRRDDVNCFRRLRAAVWDAAATRVNVAA